MVESNDTTEGADEDPLQRWQEAEQRLSTEPQTPEQAPDPGERTETAATPDEPDFGLEDVEVDSGTARYFWSAVVLANVALAGVSIGLMLIGFRGQWVVGGLLVLIGVLAGLRTRHIYRQFREYRAERDATDAGDGESTDGVSDSTTGDDSTADSG